MDCWKENRGSDRWCVRTRGPGGGSGPNAPVSRCGLGGRVGWDFRKSHVPAAEGIGGYLTFFGRAIHLPRQIATGFFDAENGRLHHSGLVVGSKVMTIVLVDPTSVPSLSAGE